MTPHTKVLLWPLQSFPPVLLPNGPEMNTKQEMTTYHVQGNKTNHFVSTSREVWLTSRFTTPKRERKHGNQASRKNFEAVCWQFVVFNFWVCIFFFGNFDSFCYFPLYSSFSILSKDRWSGCLCWRILDLGSTIRQNFPWNYTVLQFLNIKFAL